MAPHRYTGAVGKKNGRRRRIGCLVLGVLTPAVCIAAWVFLTWPDVAALAVENPESTAFIDAARARGEDVQWSWVPYNAISLEVKKAVIAAEDMSFFSHHGFDTHELGIAARDAVKGKTGARRLDHHPAVGQEPLAVAVALAAAEGA